MLVVNFFSGPSTGKSTISARLFYELKSLHLKCELIDEYAKSLVYGENFKKLNDQLLVFAKQNHKLQKIEKIVDIAIVDGPILLSTIYMNFRKSDYLDKKLFEKLVLKTFSYYNNLNFFLERNLDFYQNYGRLEDLEECKKIDEEIQKFLEINKIPYTIINPKNESSFEKIKNQIFERIEYNVKSST